MESSWVADRGVVGVQGCLRSMEIGDPKRWSVFANRGRMEASVVVGGCLGSNLTSDSRSDKADRRELPWMTTC